MIGHVAVRLRQEISMTIGTEFRFNPDIPHRPSLFCFPPAVVNIYYAF
jgi:hypothetical protein